MSHKKKMLNGALTYLISKQRHDQVVYLNHQHHQNVWVFSTCTAHKWLQLLDTFVQFKRKKNYSLDIKNIELRVHRAALCKEK